jgi:nucleoside-diphosphate-sugar epimerase
MEQQKILVTGAAGLIGKAVYKKLVSLGYNVVGVDNLSRPGSRHGDSIINCDLLDFYQSNPNDFDTIFHLAAINGTVNFYKDPNGVIKHNIENDFATFKFAESNPLTKLVYASSSEVVVGTPNIPTPEETNILIKDMHNPRWSYRISKVVAENYLANSELNYLIVRFFNVFSSDSRPGHFVHDLIDKIEKQDHSLIGADETRSFCYIDDAVNSVIAIAQTCSKEIVNIGNDEEITILDAANIISKVIFNGSVEWICKPGKQGSTARRCPDISKLKGLLPDYSPLPFKSAVEKIKNERN